MFEDFLKKKKKEREVWKITRDYKKEINWNSMSEKYNNPN